MGDHDEQQENSYFPYLLYSENTAKGSKTTSAEQKSDTKLTDIDVECIEYIFDFLNLVDLLSVADSNKYLCRISESVYSRRYGKHSIAFQNYGNEILDLWIHSDPELAIGNLRISLRLLRCFGHLISRIKVFSSSNISPIKNAFYILFYINEYCANHLAELYLYHCDQVELNRFTKPFSKVRKVDITSCLFGDSWLHRLFPSMQQLNIIGYCRKKRFNFSTIAYTFPQLEVLWINCEYEASDELYKQNLLAAIRLNPQLKSFKQVQYGKPTVDMSILQHSIDQLQNLETFDLVINCNDLTSFDGPSLHFKNVKKSNLYLSNYVVGQSVPIIPFSFGHLEELTLQTGRLLPDTAIWDFISKHPNIKKLTMDWRQTPLNVYAAKLADALPLLTEIHFTHCDFLGHEVSPFLDQFKSLKRFGFYLVENNYGDVQRLLDHQRSQWRFGFGYGDPNYFVLER